MIRRVTFAVALLTGAFNVSTQDAVARPETSAPAHRELGDVKWGRDFDAALAESKRGGKPVLILFDEVPGCATCVGYGETVLSNALLVEAIEDQFVPVAVFNNAGGADKKVLESFGEPAWNNPVVRIVDAERRELTPRVDGDYSPRGITSAMVAALARAGRPVPEYLRILAEESAARAPEKATFAMHCFWEGEAKLGALGGVLATEVGFLRGQEVVEVMFDPARLTYADLLAKAREMECATTVFTRSDAQQAAAAASARKDAVRTDEAVRPAPDDAKRQIRGTVPASLHMTPLQATRVNAAVARGEDPARYLSPKQAAVFRAARR